MRKSSFLGLTTVAILTIAGCGNDSEASSVESDVVAGDESTEETTESGEVDNGELTAEEGATAELSSVPDLDWTYPEQTGESLIEAPLAEVRIEQIAITDTLPESIAPELVPGAEGTVRAADGEQFVAAVVTVEDPQWYPRDNSNSPTPAADIMLHGNSANGLYFSLDNTGRQQATVVVSVPEDPEPQDLTLELESDGKYQQISLVNGLRVSSDVDYIYDRPRSVDIEENSWEGEFQILTGDTETLRGEIVGGHIAPLMPGQGWASPENVYLVLDVDSRDISGTGDDRTTMYLEFEDGSTVTPDLDPSSLMNAFNDPVVFQIPADARSVTAVLEIAARGGIDDYTFDDVEVHIELDSEDPEES